MTDENNNTDFLENINVLVVEDNEFSRNILIAYLKKLGIKSIAQAENGLIGYQFVLSEIFNLILTDNSMPILDGVEMTKRLRKIYYPYLIIGITANVDDVDIKLFTNVGVDYIFIKPLTIMELSHLITFIKKTV